MWLCTDVYAELRVEANASVAAGQAARAVQAEVLHVDGPVGRTPVTDDML
jgi:hypothetical protein